MRVDFLGSRRGQVAIFVLIGAIILVGALVWVMIGSSEKVDEISEDVGNLEGANNRANVDVEGDINSCLSSSVDSAVRYNLKQGGVFYYYNNSYDYFFIDILYYLNGDDVFVPDKDVLEEELSYAIKEEFSDCLSDLGGHWSSNSGVELSYADYLINVELGKERIDVRSNLEIVLEEGGVSRTFRNFRSSFDFDYLSKVDVGRRIMNFHKNSFESVFVSEINKLARENDFRYEYFLDGDSLVYTLKFDGGNYDDYIYSFALKNGLDVVEVEE